MRQPTEVRISAYRDGWTGGTQIDIGTTYEDGSGSGYRLAGPKFNGSSSLLASRKLGQREIDEIRRYLDIAESILKEAE